MEDEKERFNVGFYSQLLSAPLALAKTMSNHSSKDSILSSFEGFRFRKSMAIKLTAFICVWLIVINSLILFRRPASTFYKELHLPLLTGSKSSDSEQSSGYSHNTWNGYSVKPIAYVFPQFHAIPENDNIWGLNWTEWDNVQRATHNTFGLETIRPHPSIGYYDGLEFTTRRRQGQYLRDSGFYGVAFHHYWFGGRPVMDGIISQMLIDGEPNIPFMLSWANEPWTSRWDGRDSSETFIAQDYGTLEDWRKHFDWLLPFFRSPQYIRSDGRLQFAVYKPSHVGKHAGPMYAAWRQWAIDEGLGGLDIIETKWGTDKWSDIPPDAVNQFMPHAGGTDQSKYPLERRLTKVFHRGSMVCWDTTPRHGTEAKTEPTCHPTTWMYSMIDLLRAIKADPNPLGNENFLFVNALNEWGEGNALEPSAQFGDRYGKAMKQALEISDKEHLWRHEYLAERAQTNKEIGELQNTTKADVCVIIHAHKWHKRDQIHNIEIMVRSLQKQNNPNWRAIIYESDRSDFVSDFVLNTFDSRISFFDLPRDLKNEERKPESGYAGFDRVMSEVSTFDPICGNSTYFLWAQASDSYHPTAFDAIVNGTRPADIYSLKIQSKHTIEHVTKGVQGDDEEATPEVKASKFMPYHQRCTRFINNEDKFCLTSIPDFGRFEFSATMFNTEKFLKTGLSFSPIDLPYTFAKNLTKSGWTFVTLKESSACHVMGLEAYSSCATSGNFWFDSPKLDEVRCYRASDFGNIIGKDIKKNDYMYYREHGQCMRYTRGEYLNKVADVTGTKKEKPKDEGGTHVVFVTVVVPPPKATKAAKAAGR
ncbi:hypothetical protein TWF694_011388 [Orbilia ellipsospora]|uniref:Uncharacterized protein n=1 Tax=Orbilia ellipsospora TaxID=2528407 RepID=A0AAV9X6B7_9PEZI